MLKKKIPHVKLILAIIISYVIIKLIDNYSFFFSIGSKLLSILAPFIMAFVIAYLLNPLMIFIEKRFKLKRCWSLAITYGLILCLSASFIIWLIPMITNNLIDLVKQIPQYSSQTENWINMKISTIGFLQNADSVGFIKDQINSSIPKLSQMLKLSLDKILMETISFTTSIINLVFAFVIAIYVLYDKEKLIVTTKKLIYIILKKKSGDIFLEVCRNLNSTMGTYIGAKAIDSACVALATFIGLVLLKSQYSLLLALVVGVTNMIPYFGPLLGMIPAVLLNVFYSPIKAIWVLLFLIILQQVEGNILEPKFVGGKVGISPFLTILAVTLGGGFFGIIGMILGVPIMAVTKLYIDKLVAYYDAKKEASSQSDTNLT